MIDVSKITEYDFVPGVKVKYRQSFYGKRTREFIVYKNMLNRCYSPNNSLYHHYGGRGIMVCDRWKNHFDNFMDDMGFPSINYTLERIDNNGNYEKSNCKWATRSEQANNKSTSRFYTYNGETKTIAQWARFLGFKKETLRHRLDISKLSFEEAIKKNPFEGMRYKDKLKNKIG